jgi:hypothetical protein
MMAGRVDLNCLSPCYPALLLNEHGLSPRAAAHTRSDFAPTLMGVPLLMLSILLLAATVRQELTCLPAVLLGALPLQVAGVAVAVAARSRRRVARALRAGDPPSDALALWRGVPAWLSARGLYVSGGRLVPWSRFCTFQLEEGEGGIYEVTLHPSRVPGWRSVLVFSLVVSGLLLGTGLEAVTTLICYRSVGLRADTGAAVCALIQYIALFSLLALRARSSPRPGAEAREVTALMDARQVPVDRVSALLRSSLGKGM